MSKSIVHKITENNRATWINVIKIAHWWVFLNLISCWPKYISAQNDVIWNDFMETNQFWFVWLFFFALKLGAFLFCNLTPFGKNYFIRFCCMPSNACMYIYQRNYGTWILWKKTNAQEREREIRRKRKKKCENNVLLCTAYIWLVSVNNCNRLQALDSVCLSV